MPLGIAAQLPDSLPTYQKIGRSLRPGPVTGGIECLSLSIPATSTSLSILRAQTYIPGRYKILAVTMYVRAISAGAPKVQIVASTIATPFTEDVEIMASTALTAGVSIIKRSADLDITDVDGDVDPWLSIVGLHAPGTDTYEDLAVTVWYFRTSHINDESVDD